jgi:hypothetical protein
MPRCPQVPTSHAARVAVPGRAACQTVPHTPAHATKRKSTSALSSTTPLEFATQRLNKTQKRKEAETHTHVTRGAPHTNYA